MRSHGSHYRDQVKPNRAARRRAGRANIRQPDWLSELVERELDADRFYFAANPERQHRLRPIFPAERVQFERACGPIDTPPGAASFVAVEQVRPGQRLRAVFHADPDLNTDEADESACAAVFEGAVARMPWLLQVREQLRAHQQSGQ